jgi:hypothetical protein
MRRWLYQTVLREASRPDDLTSFLDRDTLVGLWPQLRLPAGVRRAWEELHPVLRPPRRADGLLGRGRDCHRCPDLLITRPSRRSGRCSGREAGHI